MLELAHPWALLLLLLPVGMRLLPPYREARDAVKVPFFGKLVELSQARPETGSAVVRRNRLQGVLVVLTWFCLVLAAAKPQLVGAPVEQQKSGRELMISVDISGSMETRDFSQADGTAVDRLSAVKLVLEELAAQRDSDRLGLIVFGSAPYLQAPFTDDHAVWLQLLDATAIGMAGPSTAFGDSIGLAIKLFLDGDSDNRVMIALTDGNDTSSTVPPIDAAKVAASHDIRIYTVAIGDPSAVGEDALDMKTIQRVSEVTGGRAFRALDQEELAAAYAAIAELEPQLYETVSFRPRHSLHWVPVALALLGYLFYHGWEALRGYRRRGVLPDA